MDSLKKRKKIRIENFDYATPGAYFITLCVSDRRPLLWEHKEFDPAHPEKLPLSAIGMVAEIGINQISDHYQNIVVDKYCIMPDHIHLILRILMDENDYPKPNISTVIGQFKRWVSKQVSYPLWQKSFIDRVLRNEKGYLAAWQYIDENPFKLDTAYDTPDFSNL